MPIPAALLGLIEAFGAEAGVAGATGAAARVGKAAGGAEGIGATISRMFGGAKAFGSQQELGGAVRQMEDLASMIASAKDAIAGNQQKQGDISAAAREQERLYMTADPGHINALADLERKNAEQRRQIEQSERQLSMLDARANQTTNPRSPIGHAAGIVGTVGGLGMLGGLGGSTAGSPGLANTLATSATNTATSPFGPLAGLVRSLPFVQSGQNALQAGLQVPADFAVGQAEGNAIGGMAQFGSEGAGIAMNPMALMRGDMHLHLSKLPGLLRDWSEELVKSKFTLAEFSPALSAALAEAQHREHLRNVDSGARTGGTTAELSSALQDLHDTIQPMKDTMSNVVSRGLTNGIKTLDNILHAVKVLYQLGKLVSPLLSLTDAGLKWLGRPGVNDDAFPFEKFLERAEQEKKRRFSPPKK